MNGLVVFQEGILFPFVSDQAYCILHLVTSRESLVPKLIPLSIHLPKLLHAIKHNTKAATAKKLEHVRGIKSENVN